MYYLLWIMVPELWMMISEVILCFWNVYFSISSHVFHLIVSGRYFPTQLSWTSQLGRHWVFLKEIWSVQTSDLWALNRETDEGLKHKLKDDHWKLYVFSLTEVHWFFNDLNFFLPSIKAIKNICILQTSWDYQSILDVWITTCK